MGERVIKEGGDGDADKLLSEIAKDELKRAIEAQEKAQKKDGDK